MHRLILAFRRLGGVIGVLLPVQGALAADRLVLFDADGFEVRAHLQIGGNAVFERNLFWNLAETVAPAVGFDANTDWLEGYVMPGLSFSKEIGDALTAYGKVSMVASGTLGIDAFDVGGTGRITLEDGYLGLRSRDTSGAVPWFDVSLGPRDYKAGTGMLIANGGANGFERGALKLGPRDAWERAALARFGFNGFTATGFYIEPNELPRNPTNTQIVGGDFRYDGPSDTYAGATIGYVPTSTAPYPKAAPGGIGVPTILSDGRDGLKFVNLYGRALPFEGKLENLFVSGDFAYEWNERIDMRAWGGRAQIGYTFASLGWTPVLTYTYQTFSGDDPSTPALERFDPLYYQGTPSAWSTGSKSSMVFINSNVNAHQLSLSVQPTPRDTLTFRYAYIDANQLQSPIQFGQATRLEFANGVSDPVAGVTERHLADDVYLEYIRAITPSTYLATGISASVPGAGMRSILSGDAPIWYGGYANIVSDF
ncbi:hypothetical protein K32_15060 [Kaistia sp. 32K]|uniref:alginate export family protein n=1 Tax=Kaistia sp. 32K TaxID=2795690 RepID=UPI0019168966|nr:alginate export family protein [Kaistia sp. 32K]BCP52889.1 hypothetical protein K32_15060 [Kaistia sp. 32K]